MEYLIIGIVTGLNILFIKFKFMKHRYIDGLLDTSVLIAVFILFNGSYGAMVVGMIASLMVSINLYYNPPFQKKRTLL